MQTTSEKGVKLYTQAWILQIRPYLLYICDVKFLHFNMDFTPEQKTKQKHFALGQMPCVAATSSNTLVEATQIIAFKRNSDDADSSNVSWINAFCGVCQSCGYIMQFSVSHVIK